MREAQREQSLYRHYDKDGKLLYVGVSLSAIKRLSEHVGISHWANDIASVTIEKFPNRKAVLDAEKEAITNENPIHNIMRPRISVVKKSREERLRDRLEEIAEQSRAELSASIVQYNPMYSPQEVAEMTGITQKRVKEMCENGTIGTIVVGERQGRWGVERRIRITGWQLIDFIEQLQFGNIKVLA